ncbi:MAG: hypothetical protein QF419_03845 [Acidimicrobiales bacterium]|nr:hypothetical protein [Acidimicrobiales bacterium]
MTDQSPFNLIPCSVLPDPLSAQDKHFASELGDTARHLVALMPLGAACIVCAGSSSVEVTRVPDGWVVAAPSSRLSEKPGPELPRWAIRLRLALSVETRRGT